jgi:hypothetical protein
VAVRLGCALLRILSLKVASGVLPDGRLAHHALPGILSCRCSRRCHAGDRATQALFALLKLANRMPKL